MLSKTDIVILCMPLAAAILAVLKDTFKREEKSDPGKEEKPRAKKKITPLGVAALFLAVIGFGLSFYTTNEAKKAAQRNALIENEFRASMKTGLEKELPGIISLATKELNRSISDTVEKSKLGLEDAIGTATKNSSAEVQFAIQRSGDAVARNLETAISRSQNTIKENLETTEKEIDKSINRAQTRISAVIEQSDNEIRNSVLGAVNDSSEIIKGVISTTVEKQTKRIGEMAEQAVGEQIMQIPLRIDQYQSGRLGGPLSDIVVKVGDVSKDKPFNVKVCKVYKENKENKVDSCENGRILVDKEIKPGNKSTREKEWEKISFTHPDTNNSYQLEMAIQTQRNFFGTGLDYVVIRAISLSTVARK